MHWIDPGKEWWIEGIAGLESGALESGGLRTEL
jgi:hypothetical protein